MTRTRSILLGGVALALAVGAIFLARSILQSGGPTPALPSITVELDYPGSSADRIADLVAAPIEQMVNGVEGMRWMRSHSANDGTYRLTVAFAPGTDLDIAQVRVQNRVALAMPQLPNEVQNQGITIKKRAPTLLTFVVVSSSDGRHDPLLLTSTAAIPVRDELVRLTGVRDAIVFGSYEPVWELILAPAKMATFQLTAYAVTEAIKKHNLLVELDYRHTLLPGPGSDEQAPLRIKARGRAIEREELANLVLKTAPDGRAVLLKEVGWLERGFVAPNTHASLNGKPVALLGVYLAHESKPREVASAVQEKLNDLRRHLPEGVEASVAFDFTRNLEAPTRTTPEYLRVDLQLPDAASAERSAEALARCDQLLRQAPGVRDVLSVSGAPFALETNQASLLITLVHADQRTADRASVLRELRMRLAEEVPNMECFFCDLTRGNRFPLGGYTLELVLQDVRAQGHEALLQVADNVVAEWRKSNQLTDVRLRPDARSRPKTDLLIDRVQLREQGVTTGEVFQALQANLGSYYLNNFTDAGHTYQVAVQAGGRHRLDDLKKVKLRSAQGEMISLDSVVTVRQKSGPAVVERFNLYPCVTITANSGAGVSEDEARKTCEELAEKVLRGTFRAEWVMDPAARK